MHADRPGDRPRLLYWYRTAPEIAMGRTPLDEDAIRTIEEQHPDIDFDWPAILALSQVMTPEDEAAAPPQARDQRHRRGRSGRDGESDSARRPPAHAPARDHAAESPTDPCFDQPAGAVEPAAVAVSLTASPPVMRQSNLVDQLAGREIASRLRGRYAEVTLRIRGADEASRQSLMTLAEALDPDRWDSPEAVLHGVSQADALFERLRVALSAPER